MPPWDINFSKSWWRKAKLDFCSESLSQKSVLLCWYQGKFSYTFQGKITKWISKRSSWLTFTCFTVVNSWHVIRWCTKAVEGPGPWVHGWEEQVWLHGPRVIQHISLSQQIPFLFFPLVFCWFSDFNQLPGRSEQGENGEEEEEEEEGGGLFPSATPISPTGLSPAQLITFWLDSCEIELNLRKTLGHSRHTHSPPLYVSEEHFMHAQFPITSYVLKC